MTSRDTDTPAPALSRYDLNLARIFCGAFGALQGVNALMAGWIGSMLRSQMIVHGERFYVWSLVIAITSAVFCLILTTLALSEERGGLCLGTRFFSRIVTILSTCIVTLLLLVSMGVTT